MDRETESNRDVEHRQDEKHLAKPGRIHNMIRNFGPIWFTLCMNSGIIAILMHQLPPPYQFPGLQVLATIAYMVDFVLFIIFSSIFVLRIALEPKRTFYAISGGTESLSLLATWPIAWLTVTSFVALTVSQSNWGGHDFTIVAYVMWWIGAAWNVGFVLYILVILIRRAELAEQPLQPLVLMPVVAVATLSTIGGLIATSSSNISARLAIPIMITSFCTIGLGLFMALPLYALLLHRLFTQGFPASGQAASIFILVGPMGQLAAALQLHGSAASTYGRFAGYHRGTFLTAQAAQPLNVVCVLLALMLVGMGTLWLLVAIYYMVELAVRRKLSWSMNWNSIIFPMGTLATACLQLAIELDSVFFRVITSIFIVALVLLFFVNLVFILWGIVKGDLLLEKDKTGTAKEE